MSNGTMIDIGRHYLYSMTDTNSIVTTHSCVKIQLLYAKLG